MISVALNNLDDLRTCHGLVLTGGIDLHPDTYRASPDYPNAPEDGFDRQRDDFEMAAFDLATLLNIPVLAICRGMQLVNVALGGTLIQDLQAASYSDHRRIGSTDREHKVRVTENTSLEYIITGLSGIINSAHHQAIDKLAAPLTISAWSDDNVPEAAEWTNRSDKPFLLCVQWHPERLALTHPGNPFEENIRTAFILASFYFKEKPNS
jgi:putative glutamine amidotransferase